MRLPLSVLFLTSLLILVLACSGEDSKFECLDNNNKVNLTSCFSPEFGISESEQFFYNLDFGKIENSEFLHLTYSIVDGSKLIFIFRHLHQQLFGIIDDEFEERILFQVDSDKENFVIESDNDFKNSKCIYGACGGSSPSVSFQTITGKIEGVKISDCEWEVELNLVVLKFNSTRDSIQFKEIFRD